MPDAPEQDAPAPERKHTVRHPLRIGLFALVLFGLVAGSVAWLSMDKSVTLTVDGEARAVKTYASTVGGVLDDQKITVGGHDTLAPGRETRISDGAEIVLRRGRLITLTVDGQTRQVWTTGTTVQDALDQIGYRQANLWTSSDRSTRLPLAGYQLTLRMPKSVTIVADGTKRTITTTAATVGAALDQAGMDIGANDKLSPLSTAPVRAGMTITLSRLTTKTATTEAVVEYKTVEKTDPDADPGSRTVQTKGVTGLQQVTTVMTYVNGKLTSSKVTKRVVLKKPVDEVVVVGPKAAAAGDPAGRVRGLPDHRRAELVRAGAVRVGAEPQRVQPGRAVLRALPVRPADLAGQRRHRDPVRQVDRRADPGGLQPLPGPRASTLAGLRQEPLTGVAPGHGTGPPTRGTTVTA